MSSSVTVRNDYEHGDCGQQTSSGRHHGTQIALGVNSTSPSVDGDSGAAASTPIRRRTPLTSAVEPGTREGNTRRRSQTGPPPIAAVEPGTGVENDRRTRHRRTQHAAAVEPGTGVENDRRTRKRRTQHAAAVEPGTGVENATHTRQRRTQHTAAVEPGTGVENARHTSQRRTQRTAAAQPGTRKRNTTRRRPRSSPPASDGEHSTDEDNDRPKVFEHDLTPEQRAIPCTKLLRNLGYHLSAYARAGRGPPTRNLNCRGAWHTAIHLYRKANDQYKELFIAAGFGDFVKIDPVDVPVVYNLALTERWFRETNTLHLPCCEIGPTPVDWTMVTGIKFGGVPINVDSDFTIDRALDLLGEPGAKKDGKIHLKKIAPDEKEVRGIPPTDDAREKIFRRLFLYVVGSCFFNNNRSVISHNLVQCLENINEVESYDWGSITYATFLSGMRRKVTAKSGAFEAFWQFLPFWAFEYVDVNRPKHNEVDVFPRARRWICPKGFDENESPQFIGPRFISSRCLLDHVEESQVTWQPYLASPVYRSDAMQSTINLAKKRIKFRSIYTWEYYLGERCRRQLGFPCQVPFRPPPKMHGSRKVSEDSETAAENLVRDGKEYASWFARNSIGRIVDVDRFLGGPGIAEKVLDQWRAKHLPDLIPIEQSQYDKLKKDRDALEDECVKLREELSQARGEE